MSLSPSVPGKVLIVDGDHGHRSALETVLSGRSFETQVAANGQEALERLDAFNADVIVADLALPHTDGIELLQRLKERGDVTPAIMLTSAGSMHKALPVVEELKAFWLLEKPVEPRAFEILLDRAVQHKRALQEADRLKRELALRGVLGDLVGTSPAMQELFSIIRQVAPTSAPVLICGESGTGKELVAREIHKLSPRCHRPFVAINSAALPETLIESELFGHEKGAFTGAMERRAGCFEQAQGGTLFLDEIGDMPLSTQSRLLRVLEDLHVRRLGGKSEIAVDTRVLAATNYSPQANLREDLYYRLNVFQILLPPLRDRKEDIPVIAEVMIQTLNRKHGTRVTDLHSEVLNAFQAYDWPGNARELRNVIERATIIASVGSVRLNHLSAGFGAKWGGHASQPAVDSSLSPLQPGQPLSKAEEAYIMLTLAHVNNNRKRAAEMLGISLRTLQYRLTTFRKEAKSTAASN